jgi:hypothetical protein
VSIFQVLHSREQLQNTYTFPIKLKKKIFRKNIFEKVCEYEPLGCTYNVSFSSYFTNGPNTLECLSLANLSSLVLYYVIA